jgi:hypothetical protein
MNARKSVEQLFVESVEQLFVAARARRTSNPHVLCTEMDVCLYVSA